MQKVTLRSLNSRRGNLLVWDVTLSTKYHNLTFSKTRQHRHGRDHLLTSGSAWRRHAPDRMWQVTAQELHHKRQHKEKGKMERTLGLFFFIIYQYTLVSPVLCLVQEVHTDLYLSRHPSASRRTDIPWQLGVKTRPSDVKRALPGEERDKLYSALISAGRKTGLSEDTTALSSVSILFTQLLPKRGEMIKDHLTKSFITCTYSSLNHG